LKQEESYCIIQAKGTLSVNENRSSGEKRIRILIAKPGLDGHHALKDAGMEVIYTGLHRTIDEIVNTAVQEDVDVIGLSIYSGAHLPLSKKLMDRLKEMGATDKFVLVGGNIPQRDIKALKSYGITEVFSVGSILDDIVEFIKKKVGQKK